MIILGVLVPLYCSVLYGCSCYKLLINNSTCGSIDCILQYSYFCDGNFFIICYPIKWLFLLCICLQREELWGKMEATSGEHGFDTTRIVVRLRLLLTLARRGSLILCQTKELKLIDGFKLKSLFFKTLLYNVNIGNCDILWGCHWANKFL